MEEHLRKRFHSRKTKPSLSIVFDVLYDCNMQCRGCSVSPRFLMTTAPIPKQMLRPPTEKLVAILEKIVSYTRRHNVSCYVNFGGGEPFLRSDFDEIVELSAKFFGVEGVGIDTNGTVDGEAERIERLSPCFSYLGVSLDGLEDYHNWWRGGQIQGGGFQKTVSLLRELVKSEPVLDKLEVSSVASKRNLEQLPKLMEFLNGIGIKKYSVHRAMAVGRMESMPELIPTWKEYFQLLVKVVETANRLDMDAHLHHSIESIYATLLLGVETYVSDKVGNPDAGSSLGLEPGGEIVFDPWSMRGIWKELSGGNLLDINVDLENVLHSSGGGVLDLAKLYTASNVRCHGCSYPCSGGNRIAAASQHLIKRYGHLTPPKVAVSHLLQALTEIDPACPLWETGPWQPGKKG